MHRSEPEEEEGAEGEGEGEGAEAEEEEEEEEEEPCGAAGHPRVRNRHRNLHRPGSKTHLRLASLQFRCGSLTQHRVTAEEDAPNAIMHKKTNKIHQSIHANIVCDFTDRTKLGSSCQLRS